MKMKVNMKSAAALLAAASLVSPRSPMAARTPEEDSPISITSSS